MAAEGDGLNDSSSVFIDVDALEIPQRPMPVVGETPQVGGGGGIAYGSVVDKSTGARSYHLRSESQQGIPQFIIVDEDDAMPAAAPNGTVISSSSNAIGMTSLKHPPHPLVPPPPQQQQQQQQQVPLGMRRFELNIEDVGLNNNMSSATSKTAENGRQKRARDLEPTTISPLPEAIAFDYPGNVVPPPVPRGATTVNSRTTAQEEQLARAATANNGRKPSGGSPLQQPNDVQPPPSTTAQQDDLASLRDQQSVENVFKDLWPKKFTRDIFMKSAKEVVGAERILDRGNFWDSFQSVEFLGEGSFGFVFKATTFDGETVAVKCAPVTFEVPEAIDDGFGIIREIAASRILNSRGIPGILPLHACFLVEAAESLPPHLMQVLKKEKLDEKLAERKEKKEAKRERREAHKQRIKAQKERQREEKRKEKEARKAVAARRKLAAKRKPASKSAEGKKKPIAKKKSPAPPAKRGTKKPIPKKSSSGRGRGRGKTKTPPPKRTSGPHRRRKQDEELEEDSSSDDEDEDEDEEETSSEIEEQEEESSSDDSENDASTSDDEEEEDDSSLSSDSSISDEDDDPLALTAEEIQEKYGDRNAFPLTMPTFFGITKDDAVNSTGATLMIVTNICDGDVEALIKKNLSKDQRRVVAEQVALSVSNALKGMHKLGMLHLDLKPSNILFRKRPGPDSRTGSSDRPATNASSSTSGASASNKFVINSQTDFTEVEFFLADFGNIHLITSASKKNETTKQSTVEKCAIGTYEYMDWEALENKICDRLTDSFSLGCVLCEILTSKMLMPTCVKKHQRHTTACYAGNAKKDPPLLRQILGGQYDVKQALGIVIKDLTMFDRRFRMNAAGCLSTIKAMLKTSGGGKRIGGGGVRNAGGLLDSSANSGNNSPFQPQEEEDAELRGGAAH